MKIQIAHFKYKIKFVKEPKSSSHPGVKLMGSCDNVTQTIYIKKSMSRIQTSDTLLHEILHAVWWTVGLNNLEGDNTEEVYVGVITPLLLQALTSNQKVWNLLNAKV